MTENIPHKIIISDIVPPKKAVRMSPSIEKKKPILTEPALPPLKPKKIKREGQGNKFKYWILAAVLVLIFIFWQVSRAKMEVTLTPRTISFAVDKTLNFSKDGSGGIAFSTISVPIEEKGSYVSKSKRSLDASAKGTVTIFNKFSKEPQVLVASTRLQSPDGKIYRIPKTIVVPGLQVQGGESKPGSIEVNVSADKPGGDYNIGFTDFTIPGFQGSPKFKTIFGRSKTEIKGGTSGIQNVIAKDDITNAVNDLTPKAKSHAAAMLQEKLPPNSFLLSPTADFTVLSTGVNPPAGEAGDNFTLTLKGEARGIIVDKNALAISLVQTDSNVSNMNLQNLDKLSIKLSNYKYEVAAFTAAFKGSANTMSTIDPYTVRSLIKNQNISDPLTLLTALPQASKAIVKFSPFWLRRIPQNSGSIDIIIEGR